MFEHKFKKNARVSRKRSFGDNAHGTILFTFPGVDVYSVVFDDGTWGTEGILCTAEVLTLIAPVPDEPVSSTYSVVEQFSHIQDTEPYIKKVGSSVVALVNSPTGYELVYGLVTNSKRLSSGNTWIGIVDKKGDEYDVAFRNVKGV